MIKLVKNEGQVKELAGKCRYLFSTDDFSVGTIYAKPGLRPIIGYIWAKLKGGFTKDDF